MCQEDGVGARQPFGPGASTSLRASGPVDVGTTGVPRPAPVGLEDVKNPVAGTGSRVAQRSVVVTPTGQGVGGSDGGWLETGYCSKVTDFAAASETPGIGSRA